MTPIRLAALALVLAAVPTAARADNLDYALMQHAFQIRKYLEVNEVKNVGVLNFRAQKGAGREGFALGTVATAMPLRLETVLVVVNNPQQPIGVIQDASRVAEASKARWHTHPADREKLFAVTSYQLAWGTARVRPDALLTGVVHMDQDLKAATIKVEAILAKSPTAAREVCSFRVKTDRELLRQLGQSYAVPRGVATRSARDAQAVADARRRDQAPPATPGPDALSGLRFEVLYDGVSQPVRADDRSPGEWRIDPPRAGQKVTFHVTNVGPESRVGACIRVNGRSVWKQLEGEPDSTTGIWLFDKGKAHTAFGGFYTALAGDNLVPFRVLGGDELAGREAEFGGKVGVIDVDTFTSGGGGEPEVEGLSISRGLSRAAAGRRAKSSEDLRAQLIDQNPLLRKVASLALSRSLIAADDAAIRGPEVQSADLPDRKPGGRVTIRYYDPQGAGAMQISK